LGRGEGRAKNIKSSIKKGQVLVDRAAVQVSHLLSEPPVLSTVCLCFRQVFLVAGVGLFQLVDHVLHLLQALPVLHVEELVPLLDFLLVGVVIRTAACHLVPPPGALLEKKLFNSPQLCARRGVLPAGLFCFVKGRTGRR
jgi:hypothetical protein